MRRGSVLGKPYGHMAATKVERGAHLRIWPDGTQEHDVGGAAQADSLVGKLVSLLILWDDLA